MEDIELDVDGIDRRGFLKCMAWAGTGVIYAVHGGILKSVPLGDALAGKEVAKKTLEDASFSFVQISDSHIGFSKDANKDVIGTLQKAIDKINKSSSPDLLLHTGDLSHLSKVEEFDALDQVLKSASTQNQFFVPGEHDVLVNNGATYMERYGKGTKGKGWHSFDHKGVHFIGLVNVVDLKSGGLGVIGDDQLKWLADDVQNLASSTPIVVFAHIPMWSLYPEWGWGTDDAARALEILKRFGSLTVLNGHIHQVMQKVEGTVSFHTAMSTAFPQPKPGQGPGPGPMKVPAGKLMDYLGVTNVKYLENQGSLAIIDSTLSEMSAQDVTIQSFAFNPPTLTVKKGTKVTWTNQDDAPHTVADEAGNFKSQALDTGQSFGFRYTDAGTFGYFCSMHPYMKGKVVVW